MSKKRYFFILSLLMLGGLLFILFNPFEFGGYLFQLLFSLTIASLVGYLYKRRYSNNNISFNKYMLFIILYVSSSYLFIISFPTLAPIIHLIFALLVSSWLYFLLLALNIHIVSIIREIKIPLIQPSRVVTAITIVTVTFFLSTFIYKQYVPLIPIYPSVINFSVQLLLFIILIGLLLYSIEWFYKSYGAGEDKENEIFGIRNLNFTFWLIISEAFLLFMFYPFEAFGKGIIIATVMYILLTFSINYFSHKLNKRFYLESVLLLVFTYILAYLI